MTARSRVSCDSCEQAKEIGEALLIVGMVAAITGRYEMTNAAQREVVAKLTAAPVVKVKRRKGE